MSKLSIIVDGASALLNYIKKSPIVKKDSSLEIVKKKDGKGIGSVTPKVDSRTLGELTKRDIDVPELSTITKPSTSNGSSLLSHIARKNEIMQEANDLTRALIERKDIANEIRTASMRMKYDLSVANTLAVEGLGLEMKLAREFDYAKGLLDIDKLNFDMFGLTTEGTQFKNSDDVIIIPLHEKAKKDSEKAIETEAMNKMSIGEDLLDALFNELNPFDKLIDEVKGSMHKMNDSIYSEDSMRKFKKDKGVI